MMLRDILSPTNVVIDSRASSKTALLTDMAKRSATVLGLSHALVLEAILRREELGSTGMGDGTAIPHARIAGVLAPFCMVARLSRAIEFAAIDGKPVDIVVLLLLPVDAGSLNLAALANVTRVLRDPERVAAARRAVDPDALWCTLVADPAGGG